MLVEQAAQGVVRSFTEGKGWGAVTAPGLETDVRVHLSAVEADGWGSLDAGGVVPAGRNEEGEDRFWITT